MNTPNFLNPFNNYYFLHLTLRLIIIYVAAALLLLFLYRKGPVERIKKSNLVLRYVGWLMLTPVYLLAIYSGRVIGISVVVLFISGALLEYGRISRLPRQFRISMVALGVWSVMVAAFEPKYFYGLPILYFLIYTMQAIRVNDPEKSFKYAAYSMYGSIWLIFSLCHIVLLSEFNNTLDSSRSLLFLVVFAVALADIGGYVFGKLFHKLQLMDKYKVANRLSPNKTYIGTLGYIIGAGAAIWLSYFAIKGYLSAPMWAVVAVLIGVFSFVGGLTSSFFKRNFDVKDSGSFIPGHGGVIDRLDSLARVVVILYYFLKIAI